MTARRHERRRNSGEFRVRPRKSPADMIILTVVGALMATAAATVFLGGGLEDGTPHGQVLGALRIVAEAQERHLQEHGQFAAVMGALDVAAPESVELTMLAGGRTRWEVLARHPVGLGCAQVGRVQRGRVVLDTPQCFTNPDP